MTGTGALAWHTVGKTQGAALQPTDSTGRVARLPGRAAGSCGGLMCAALLLGACAPLYPAQIAPEGNDVYLITQTATSAFIDARAAALKRAGAFCEKQHRRLQLLTPDIASSPAESPDHAELEFRCDPKS